MFGFLERWLVIGEETEDSVSRNEFNREIIILRLRVCVCVCVGQVHKLQERYI